MPDKRILWFSARNDAAAWLRQEGFSQDGEDAEAECEIWAKPEGLSRRVFYLYYVDGRYSVMPEASGTVPD